MMNRRLLALSAVLTSSALAIGLAGCATTPSTQTDGLSIVASTNVYGDLAASIAGDLATVTSIIDSPAQDPHSYEASAQEQLAIANAGLVIKNGGGYDPFIDSLVDSSGSTATVVSAVEASGLLDDGAGDDSDAHAGGNEHVWYSVHGMSAVATAVTAALVEADADNSTVFETNLENFIDELDALEAETESIADEAGGGDVVVTEVVPVYLLNELGLADVTPEEFTEAIEEGADVPPLALQATLDLIASGDVRMLAYNEQTASPETERLRTAAEEAGVPVVSFTETLPGAQDYVSWMRANLEAVGTALNPS